MAKIRRKGETEYIDLKDEQINLTQTKNAALTKKINETRRNEKVKSLRKTKGNRNKKAIMEIKHDDNNMKSNDHNNIHGNDNNIDNKNNAVEQDGHFFQLKRSKQINPNETNIKSCNDNIWDMTETKERIFEATQLEEKKTKEFEEPRKIYENEIKKKKKRNINSKNVGLNKNPKGNVIDITDEKNPDELFTKIQEQKEKIISQTEIMENNTRKGKRGRKATRIKENQTKQNDTLKQNEILQDWKKLRRSKTNIADYFSYNKNDKNYRNQNKNRSNKDIMDRLNESETPVDTMAPSHCFSRAENTPTKTQTAIESLETNKFKKKERNGKTPFNISVPQSSKRIKRNENPKQKNLKKHNSFEHSTEEQKQENRNNNADSLDKYYFLKFICSPPKTVSNNIYGERPRKSSYSENLNYIKKNMEKNANWKKEREMNSGKGCKNKSDESENGSEALNIWEEAIFFHKQKKRERHKNNDKQKCENNTNTNNNTNANTNINTNANTNNNNNNNTTEVIVIKDDDTNKQADNHLKENLDIKKIKHSHISNSFFVEAENRKFFNNEQPYAANFTDNAEKELKRTSNDHNIFEDYWNKSTAKKKYPYSEKTDSPFKKKNTLDTNPQFSVGYVNEAEKKKENETEIDMEKKRAERETQKEKEIDIDIEEIEIETEEERKKRKNEEKNENINHQDSRNNKENESNKEESSNSDKDLKENERRDFRMWKSLYRYLGVSKYCTEEAIKKAFKEKIKVCHPDKGGNVKKFLKLKMSYDILSNRKKRKLYDRYGNSVLEMIASDKYVDCSVSSEEKSDEEELVELEECSQIFDLFVAKYYNFSYLNNLGDLKINGDQYNEFQNLVFHLFTMENKIFKNLFFIYPTFSPFITPIRRTKKLKEDEQFIADREMEREELFANAFEEMDNENSFYSTSEISPLVFRMTKEMKSMEKSKMKKKVTNIFNTLQSEFTFFCNKKNWASTNTDKKKQNEDPFDFSNECRTPNHYDAQAQWKYRNDKGKETFFNNSNIQETTKMELSPLTSKIRNESSDKLWNDFCRSFNFFFENEKYEFSSYEETEEGLNNTRNVSVEFSQRQNECTTPTILKNRECYEYDGFFTPLSNCDHKKCYTYNYINPYEENQMYWSVGKGEHTNNVTPSTPLNKGRKGKRGRKKKQEQETSFHQHGYINQQSESCDFSKKEKTNYLFSEAKEPFNYFSSQNKIKYSFSLDINSPNQKMRPGDSDEKCVHKKTDSSPFFYDRGNSITVEEKYGFNLHKKGDIKINDLTQSFNYIYIGNSKDKKKKYILFLKEEGMQHFLQIKLLLKEIKENKQHSNLKLVSIYENSIDKHLKNIDYLLLLITDKEEQIPLSDFYLLDKIKFLEQFYCIPMYIKKNTVTRPNFYHIKWIVYTLQSLVYFLFFFKKMNKYMSVFPFFNFKYNWFKKYMHLKEREQQKEQQKMHQTEQKNEHIHDSYIFFHHHIVKNKDELLKYFPHHILLDFKSVQPMQQNYKHMLQVHISPIFVLTPHKFF